MAYRCWVDILFPEIAVRSTLNNRDDNNGDPPTDDEKQNKIQNLAEHRHREEPVVEEDNGQLG